MNSQTFILLGGLKCEKLANNVIKATNKVIKNSYLGLLVSDSHPHQFIMLFYPFIKRRCASLIFIKNSSS